MRSLFLPYRKRRLGPDASWAVVGRDSHGADFGVGVGPVLAVAEQRLRDWVLDSLAAAADDGEDRLEDLTSARPRGAHLTFAPDELVPLRLRLLRAQSHLTQEAVAKRLGLTQQGYARFERPGANLQLRTIEQVERALGRDLLALAPPLR